MFNNKIYNLFVKRILDFFTSLVFIILLIPLFLLISISIILDSGFPVFYRPYRGGFRNKKFRIYKFRTMVKDADRIGGGTTALNDTRITRVGKMLRKTKLDEIPQLFNILFGTMSFIGPRPELLKYTDSYEGENLKIFNVRPGLSDYSSLKFINLDELVGVDNVDSYYEKHIFPIKNKLRVKYAQSNSFVVDLKLFFMTIIKVIKKMISVVK